MGHINSNNNNYDFYLYNTGAFKAPPCTHLSVSFTNKEETAILILVKEKIERFSRTLRPPSHPLRGFRQEISTRLGTVSG